jgi:hypothetical protein
MMRVAIRTNRNIAKYRYFSSGTALAYQTSKNTKAAESFLQAATAYTTEAGETFAQENPSTILEYYMAELDFFEKQQDHHQILAISTKIVGVKVLGQEKLAGKRLVVSRSWYTINRCRLS